MTKSCGHKCSCQQEDKHHNRKEREDQHNQVGETLILNSFQCVDCAEKVQAELSEIKGVTQIEVNSRRAEIELEYDSSLIDRDKILDLVENKDYRCDVHATTSKSNKTAFRLEGLDCADCADKLEKRLTKTPGVESAEVNFGAAKMTVKHTAKVEDIIRVTEEAGYKAELEGEVAGPKRKEKPFYKDTRIILTGVSGLFLFAGFLASLLQIPDQAVIGLFLGAMVTGGLFVVRSALYSLKSLSLDMNVLMSVAAIGAAAIGEWGEGATVVFLFALGNALQTYSMEKTRNSIRELMELSPREALVKRNGREITLPVEEIATGDVIIVQPGERIAMDGKVVTGTSMVNQAPITGESMPVEKVPGAEAFAGTVNDEGALEIEVSRLVQDTTLAKIVDMVEEAQAQRAPSQQFVDVFAKYYTPVVIGIAVAIATIPPLGLGLPFTPWLEKALILLVIACPCALVISTPVSIISAIGSAAKRGVLIKGGAYLEAAGALKVVAFDKTGTLTEGRPEVTDVLTINGSDKQNVLSIAVAVENRSQHPLAQAINRRAGQQGIISPESEDFQSITGKGAGAIIDGRRHYVGNIRLFEDLQVKTFAGRPLLGKLQKEGKTAMLVGTGEEITGIIAVADRPRSNSAATLRALKKAGIQKTVMLTGDNTGTARAMASQLGVDDFEAELLPEDKLGIIKELQTEHGKVAMVGDGVNDAPALATANVGIAMGGAGTDTALETADIALMADDLSKLPYAVDLSRRALRVIKQNIAFALLVKAVFIAGTFMGITNLWMAIFADTGASLIVIANGMRLMRVKEKAAYEKKG